MGLRVRFFRSFYLRAVSATDLIPNVFDPKEKDAVVLLKTIRNYPLYFNPQDKRLEALHWLVVGATGSGKSFFTGLVLKRLIEQGQLMSVLFIDHNRSFRRMVLNSRHPYFEPQSLEDLKFYTNSLFNTLNKVGGIAGIELSDFDSLEKKEAAKNLLTSIEDYLRKRESIHPVYIVLDECWNFLKDEPVLVQRAFREFRKLNGAAIAITQSLSDFLMDESGRSIFQNAPIRILLRQGEDLAPYKGVLGLNSVELKLLRQLKQKKGVYSECLIKTPFLSKLSKLYPTSEEHKLLRTDNIREEIIFQNRKLSNLSFELKKSQEVMHPCVA